MMRCRFCRRWCLHIQRNVRREILITDESSICYEVRALHLARHIPRTIQQARYECRKP